MHVQMQVITTVIDIKKCENNKVTSYVTIPAQKVSKKTNVPQPEYYHDEFSYDE